MQSSSNSNYLSSNAPFFSVKQLFWSFWKSFKCKTELFWAQPTSKMNKTKSGLFRLHNMLQRMVIRTNRMISDELLSSINLAKLNKAESEWREKGNQGGLIYHERDMEGKDWQRIFWNYIYCLRKYSVVEPLCLNLKMKETLRFRHQHFKLKYSI